MSQGQNSLQGNYTVDIKDPDKTAARLDRRSLTMAHMAIPLGEKRFRVGFWACECINACKGFIQR